MSQTNNAPTDMSVTATADVPESGASESFDSFDSTDDIAAFLDAEDSHPEGATADDAQSQDDPGQDASAEEGGEETAAEAIPAPASWGKDVHEIFAKLPAELQKTIARREADRETFVQTKGQEAAYAKAEHQKLLGYAQGQLAQAIQRAQLAIEGEFAGIDMATLKQQDPNLYLRLEGMREQRLAAVADALRGQQELAAYAQQERQKEHSRALAAEITAAKPRVLEIIGKDKNPREWRDNAVKYLEGLGAPQEHINGLTHSYQVELVAKAMKYDEMSKQAANAEKKIAEAAKVLKPGGVGGDGGTSTKQKAAWDTLRKNPKSNDAIVGLLNAL